LLYLLNLQNTLDPLARSHDGSGQESGKASGDGKLENRLVAYKSK
jgi:hypothetical protein